MVKGNRQAPRSYTPERSRADAARGDRVRARLGRGDFEVTGAKNGARDVAPRMRRPMRRARANGRARCVDARRARDATRARDTVERASMDRARRRRRRARAATTRARRGGVGVGATRNPQTRAATSRMRLGGARANSRAYLPAPNSI